MDKAKLEIIEINLKDVIKTSGEGLENGGNGNAEGDGDKGSI